MEEPIVLVTGASGYVAAHVVKTLQSEGYRVRGTVRSIENKAKVGELTSLCPDAKYPLELVEADLTDPSSWQGAVSGCTYVIHTASPFPPAGKTKDPEKELIKPAVEGTTSVIQAALDAGTVKRVVLTSSGASVFGSYQPSKTEYTEDDWTDTESPECDAYYKSKTLAEKAAWKIIEDNPGKLELAVINPLLVLGPPLTKAASSSTSVQIIKSSLERQYPAVPLVFMGICDIRDVAKAHVKAMTLPEAAGNRHLIYTETLAYTSMGKILEGEFKAYGYSPMTSTVPKFLAWLGSWCVSELAFIYPRWGAKPNFSNKRMREVLQIEPTPVEKTLIEMGHALIKLGMVKETSGYRRAHAESQKE